MIPQTYPDMPFSQAVVDVSLLLDTVHPTLVRMDLTWPCQDEALWPVLVPAATGKHNVFDAIRTNMPELNEIQLGGGHVWPDNKYAFLCSCKQLVD